MMTNAQAALIAAASQMSGSYSTNFLYSRASENLAWLERMEEYERAKAAWSEAHTATPLNAYDTMQKWAREQNDIGNGDRLRGCV